LLAVHVACEWHVNGMHKAARVTREWHGNEKWIERGGGIHWGL
jgi:hypothetical protein